MAGRRGANALSTLIFTQTETRLNLLHFSSSFRFDSVYENDPNCSNMFVTHENRFLRLKDNSKC